MRYIDTSVLVAYLTQETNSPTAEAFMLSQERHWLLVPGQR